MEPTLKLRERAERYRRIARNTFNAKIADEIEKIAEDYEHWTVEDESQLERASSRWEPGRAPRNDFPFEPCQSAPAWQGAPV